MDFELFTCPVMNTAAISSMALKYCAASYIQNKSMKYGHCDNCSFHKYINNTDKTFNEWLQIFFHCKTALAIQAPRVQNQPKEFPRNCCNFIGEHKLKHSLRQQLTNQFSENRSSTSILSFTYRLLFERGE